MTNRLGQQLGNYRLINLLGRGGFAEVYLGEHIHLGTQAAIKVLHTQVNTNEIEMFRKEARTIARLEHPTGCATSFTSTAIRFESILHRFSFSRKRRCLNPCPWTSASVERACQGASIENTAALCILWARLIQADESLARTAGQVEAFCHMLRQRQGYRLRGWLEEVEQHGEPELQAFARNLHKEESAVQAGLTLAWSNGPTEGFIHRLKLLKRQAYGRAGVALLKQRMLFHPSDLIAA